MQQFYIKDHHGTTSIPYFRYGGGNSSTTTRRAGVIGRGGQILAGNELYNFWLVWLSLALCEYCNLTYKMAIALFIFNLAFCDQTAEGVPANPNNFSQLNISGILL